MESKTLKIIGTVIFALIFVWIGALTALYIGG